MVVTPAHAWDDHAEWYMKRHGKDGDAHHREILIPAILRQLRLKPDMHVLDCCCGHGVVARALAAQGVSVTGVDGCAPFIDYAQQMAGPQERYHLADAHSLRDVLQGDLFDATVLVMSLQDLDPIAEVLGGIASLSKAGATLICILTHPCFRIPQQSDWHYDKKRQVQQRTIDAYLSKQSIDIQMGGGAESHSSTHYHRPLHYYIRQMGQAGLGLTDAEELCTQRRGSTGHRSAAEDLAQREFPMFLLLKAQKL